MTTLTSDNLTRLTALLKTQNAAGKASDAEYWRLTKILRPDILGETVTRREEPTEVATVGIVIKDAPTANRTIGIDPDEAKRRQDDIDRITRGEPLVERMDIQSQINHEARKRAAIEVVIERLENEIRNEKRKLAIAHCKTLKPSEVEKMKRLFKALADVHAIHLEVSDTCQDLRDSEIGFHGIVYGLTPDFLEHPRDRQSDMAEFFREGQKRGYVASMPKEFAL